MRKYDNGMNATPLYSPCIYVYMLSRVRLDNRVGSMTGETEEEYEGRGGGGRGDGGGEGGALMCGGYDWSDSVVFLLSSSLLTCRVIKGVAH